MRPGPIALLLALLAAPVAAQVPGWSATLELAAPAGAGTVEAGNATVVKAVARYALEGGLCAAGQAPAGMVTLALSATGADGVTVAVAESSRSVALACGVREETFDLTLAVAAGASSGARSILITADASPTCTLPCGLAPQRAEAVLPLTVPARPAPPAPPATGAPAANLSEQSGGAVQSAPQTADGADLGLPLLLVPALAGLVAALLVALLVMNRIAR